MSYQLLHVTTHLRQLTGLDHVLFERIARRARRSGSVRKFCAPRSVSPPFHGGFTHAEELHKAGVKAGEVTGGPKVEQMRVPGVPLQQNSADHLRTFRHPECPSRFPRVVWAINVGESRDYHTRSDRKVTSLTHAGFASFPYHGGRRTGGSRRR